MVSIQNAAIQRGKRPRYNTLRPNAHRHMNLCFKYPNHGIKLKYALNMQDFLYQSLVEQMALMSQRYFYLHRVLSVTALYWPEY